jgi:hypothetical protein
MTSFKVMTWTRSLLVCSAFAAAAAVPALGPAEAIPSYDGVWSVVIITRAGLCDPSYRYPIRISNGQVLNAGRSQVHISGRVGKNGAVVVNVNSEGKSAIGTGRLAERTGGGSWTGGNGACSGVWQAERRST